ncbi:MAG: metallophosphoesterase [bacterium]
MRIFLPVVFVAVVILVLGLVSCLLLWGLNRPWWRRKIIRRAAIGLPLSGIITIILWSVGEYTGQKWLAFAAAIITNLAVVLQLCLIISLPFSGLVHLVRWVFGRLSPADQDSDQPLNEKRRLFLQTATVAVPLLSVSAGVSGFTGAFADVRVYLRPLVIDTFPSDLSGLRLLHLSDLHLGRYVTLNDLADILSRTQPMSVDLVLLTGDVADDLQLLPDALAMIEQLNPPLGAFACLGNHEYYRGITAVRRAFDHSSISLLVNSSVRIAVGTRHLLVAGLDDPRSMVIGDTTFFGETLQKTMRECLDGEPVLLMSHRPDVFGYAAEADVNLTLAGHTHGGQIGLGNRSLFEMLQLQRYPWGHYQLQRSHLYTSSGVGHWFPFRLGCPREAPVIELRR